MRAAARAGRVPARGPVAELRRHDREHATAFVATLRAWLEAQGDLADAAQRLGVHPNTVRYRLRRVADVTGYAPTDPRGAHTLRIALALGRLDGATS